MDTRIRPMPFSAAMAAHSPSRCTVGRTGGVVTNFYVGPRDAPAPARPENLQDGLLDGEPSGEALQLALPPVLAVRPARAACRRDPGTSRHAARCSGLAGRSPPCPPRGPPRSCVGSFQQIADFRGEEAVVEFLPPPPGPGPPPSPDPPPPPSGPGRESPGPAAERAPRRDARCRRRPVPAGRSARVPRRGPAGRAVAPVRP